jgi:hypothetical protein
MDFDAILAILGGGAQGFGRGLEHKRDRDRQHMLDQELVRERASQQERRDYENLSTVSILNDRGIRPASTVTDRVDFAPEVAAGVGAVGGLAVGLPPAQTANPATYTRAGRAGGQDFFFNPLETKEARTTAKTEATRAAEVGRLLQMQKPDGKPITRAEAEAIVDKNLSPSDVFRERNIDPLSPEGLAADRKRDLFAHGLAQSRDRESREATARTPKQMAPDDVARHLDSTAERYIQTAATQLGDQATPRQLLEYAAGIAAKEPEGLAAYQKGLAVSHFAGALQRHKDRFTAKSKAGGEADPVATFMAGGAPPAAAAPAPASGGKQPAPDDVVKAVARKHNGNVAKTRAELESMGYDGSK